MKSNIKKKTFSRGLLAAGLALATLLTIRPAAADLRIGFVNVDRVLHDAAPAQKAQQRLQREFQPREQELQRLAKQGQDLQNRLEKEKLTASDAQQRGREQQLAQLSRDYQAKQHKLSNDYNTRRNAELAQLHEKIRRTVISIAQRDKLDLVLYDGVAYVNPRIDLTDRVIKSLAGK